MNNDPLSWIDPSGYQAVDDSTPDQPHLRDITEAIDQLLLFGMQDRSLDVLFYRVYVNQARMEFDWYAFAVNGNSDLYRSLVSDQPPEGGPRSPGAPGGGAPPVSLAPTVSQSAADVGEAPAWQYWLNYTIESAGWALVGFDVLNSVVSPTPDIGIAGVSIIGSARVARAMIPSSKALARALEAAGRTRPAGESAAHHIVAGSAQGAAAARAMLQRFGIGINEAANGVFLPTARHVALHTKEYYAAVERTLGAATSRAEAEQALQSIADALRIGRFP